jgi:hypothetical protein
MIYIEICIGAAVSATKAILACFPAVRGVAPQTRARTASAADLVLLAKDVFMRERGGHKGGIITPLKDLSRPLT